MTSKVAVPKPLLAGLAAVAGAAVLGIVFLLGRESTRGVPPMPARDTVAAPLPGLPPQPLEPPSEPQPPAAFVPALTPVPALAVPAPPPPPPQAPDHRAEREAVAAYFRAVDRLQPELKGDPESAAQQIVAGVSKGDASGLDAMDQQARTARNRMAALTPPPPCAAFHQESLALMDAGQALMAGLKQAMSSPDGSRLGELSDRANALKARTEALRAQEAALRRQYGQ